MNVTLMDVDLKNIWVKALRSGRYNQNIGSLKRFQPVLNKNTVRDKIIEFHSTAGVLCNLMLYKVGGVWQSFEQVYNKKLNLPSYTQEFVDGDGDSSIFSFTEMILEFSGLEDLDPYIKCLDNKSVPLSLIDQFYDFNTISNLIEEQF